MDNAPTDPEHLRLAQDKDRKKYWRRWGPYLSERQVTSFYGEVDIFQWGTVREDYSPNGDTWNYFTHDQARSRAYRWGEDGILGFTDNREFFKNNLE